MNYLIGAWKCNLPPLLGTYDRLIDILTDQQTDMRGHRGVTLSITINNRPEMFRNIFAVREM